MDNSDGAKDKRRGLELLDLEDGVKGALARLRIPRREELASISERLNKVARRLEQLEKAR